MFEPQAKDTDRQSREKAEYRPGVCSWCKRALKEELTGDRDNLQSAPPTVDGVAKSGT